MSKKNSEPPSMPDAEPAALDFMKGRNKKPSTPSSPKADLAVVPAEPATNVEPPQETPTKPNTKSTKRKKAQDRTELPMASFSHFVREDIPVRLERERLRHKEAGIKKPIKAFVDEAMDIGLRQIEKRELNS